MIWTCVVLICMKLSGLHMIKSQLPCFSVMMFCTNFFLLRFWAPLHPRLIGLELFTFMMESNLLGVYREFSFLMLDIWCGLWYFCHQVILNFMLSDFCPYFMSFGFNVVFIKILQIKMLKKKLLYFLLVLFSFKAKCELKEWGWGFILLWMS